MEDTLKIRAGKEQIARWKAAAGKRPLSGWVRDVLDAEADSTSVPAPVSAPEPLPAKRSVLSPAIVSAAQRVRSSGGGCPMYAPRGTKCRACGKEH